LKEVFQIIGDGAKIIKYSTFNIKTSIELKKGFEYIKTLGISVQRCDTNKTIFEICNQCLRNKIKLKLIIDNVQISL